MPARHYFISFNRHDRDWATWIAWTVESLGHRATYQDWDFPPGGDFVEAMHRATADCDAIIAVLSPTYLESKLAGAEWRVAFARDPSGAESRLVPVRVRVCAPEGLLQTRTYLDLVGRDLEAARRLLESALREGRGKPDREPPFPAPAMATAAPAPVFPGAPDAFEEYREWALDKHGRIELIGLGAGDFPFDLDDLYVPLRMGARGFDPGDTEAAGPKGRALRERDDAEVTLERAFAIAGDRRELAVLGEAGSGKTTALRKLLHQALTAGGASLGLAPATLPVFLRLRRFGPEQLAGSLAAFLQRELDAEAPGRFPHPFADSLWRRGDLLLLLDGLDELADDALRAGVCAFLDQQLAGLRKRHIRAVLSSRYSGFGREVKLHGRFLPLEVRPLDDALIRRLVESWFRAAHRQRALLPERRPEADAEAQRDAEGLLAALREKDYSSQQILTLVSTPLLLTLLCIVVLRGSRIPRRRAQFYAECLRVLLGRWSVAKKIVPLLDEDDALGLLREVAWHLHKDGRRDDLTAAEFAEVTRARRERLARRLERPLPAGDLLDWLQRGAAVIAEYAPDRFGFSHLGLQEYLVAAHVAEERGERLQAVAARFGEDWWKETTLLLVGLPGHGVFAPLMREVAARGPVVEQLELLRRCLDEAHDPSAEPFVEAIADPALDDVRRAGILHVFAGRRDPDVGRAALALLESRNPELRVLSRRLAEEAGLEVPPLAATVPGMEPWVEATTGIRFLPVPGGRFVMGADDIDADSRPPHPVRVSPFWLAETPVTNRQYALFLAAKGHAEPAYWRDGRFSGPELPVVGVSWHDAMAFCKWLSQACGRTVGLPSEAQWEFAARGEDGRPYPWGLDPPDITRAAFDRDLPSPVGSVPAGRGPYGHLDLAGNVWEWCADVWTQGGYRERAKAVGEPLDPVATGDPRRLPRRALRGGGWFNSADYLRAAYRLGRRAVARGGRRGGGGFRVAVSSASTVAD